MFVSIVFTNILPAKLTGFCSTLMMFDSNCKRFGQQAWVMCVIVATEFLIAVKVRFMTHFKYIQYHRLSNQLKVTTSHILSTAVRAQSVHQPAGHGVGVLLGGHFHRHHGLDSLLHRRSVLQKVDIIIIVYFTYYYIMQA